MTSSVLPRKRLETYYTIFRLSRSLTSFVKDYRFPTCSEAAAVGK